MVVRQLTRFWLSRKYLFLFSLLTGTCLALLFNGIFMQLQRGYTNSSTLSSSSGCPRTSSPPKHCLTNDHPVIYCLPLFASTLPDSSPASHACNGAPAQMHRLWDREPSMKGLSSCRSTSFWFRTFETDYMYCEDLNENMRECNGAAFLRTPGSQIRSAKVRDDSGDQGYEPVPTGVGQSSSVMLDQNIQIMTTESRVKSVWKSDPSIFPLVPSQM